MKNNVRHVIRSGVPRYQEVLSMKNNVRHVIRSGVLYESMEPNIDAISMRYDSFAEAYQIWGANWDPKTKSIKYFSLNVLLKW